MQRIHLDLVRRVETLEYRDGDDVNEVRDNKFETFVIHTTHNIVIDVCHKQVNLQRKAPRINTRG